MPEPVLPFLGGKEIIFNTQGEVFNTKHGICDKYSISFDSSIYSAITVCRSHCQELFERKDNERADPTGKELTAKREG